jgi:putative PIN family toxin of toxin-antitoxin system
MFGSGAPFAALVRSLQSGTLTWAVSTEILMEYDEVISREAGVDAATRVMRVLELASRLWGNVRLVSPSFRFQLICDDPDDNKFADCAIVADAEYIITSDHHFRAMVGSGYKPQPISPEEFVMLHLGKA